MLDPFLFQESYKMHRAEMWFAVVLLLFY